MNIHAACRHVARSVWRGGAHTRPPPTPPGPRPRARARPQGPCCHDALSARLIERAGFDFAFMSGFCTAAARLGAPDTGLMSYAEMVDTGRYCHEATSHLPSERSAAAVL